MQDLKATEVPVEQPKMATVTNPQLLLAYLIRLHAQRLAMIEDLKAIKAAIDVLETYHP